MEGIFYVTIFGTILGVALVLFEYAFHIMRVAGKARIPLKEAFKQELKFFFKFGSNVKPVLEGPEESDEKTSPDQSRSERSKSKTTTTNGDGVRPYGFVVSSPSLDRLTESP